MQVRNLVNANGREVPNQFIITGNDGSETFQSYATTIAKRHNGTLTLDNDALDYSRTTSRHLYHWCGMKRKQLEAGIAAGTIKTANLNED